MTFIRVVELFSGIGAQNAALRMSGLEYEIVAVCEIDEKAYMAYCALNDECPPNLGDITKVERLPECDLMTFSAPCTDISNAGQKKGMEEGSGTRTSLIFEVPRVIENTPERERERPMYCLGENVPDIVNKKNRKHFLRFVQRMSSLGYSCKYGVLNSKNFGVPQNRNRCFMIFSRKGVPDFPKGWDLDRCLLDILEENVDIKYYLSQKMINGLIIHRERQRDKGHGFGFEPVTVDGIAHTVTTGEGSHNSSTYIIAKTTFDSDRVVDPRGSSDPVCAKHVPKILIRNNTELGYIEAQSGDGIILDQPKSKTKRGRVQHGCAPTIMTSGQVGVILIDGESYSIRRLTPRECFRLFGFTEEQIDRVFSLELKGKVLSDSALYKIAGNSIVVPVLSEIFKTMFNQKNQKTLFSF